MLDRNLPRKKESTAIAGVKSRHLHELYLAKCLDLQLQPQPEQERRFVDFCAKCFHERKITMRESGLGERSAAVFAQIITGEAYCQLDLGKNKLGNAGVLALLKGIKSNCSLVHLDLGSNDLTSDSAIPLFTALSTHMTLTSLNLSNHDRLHRNRLGNRSCAALGQMLATNHVIAMLNVADNAINNDGLRIIALNKDSSLVSLNLGNNELNGREAVQIIAEFIGRSK